MPVVKLQSSDSVVVEVDVDAIKCSETIKGMIEALGLENEDEVVPVPNVKSGAILKKIVDWAVHHKDDTPAPEEDYEKTTKMRELVIGPWDKDFLPTEQSVLFELMEAANYLDIKGLLDLTCKHVADMIKDKNVDEVRKMFNIKSDLTIADEEQIRKENGWMDEK